MAAAPLPRFWNVPNALSLGRLALTLPLCGLIAYRQYVAALVVFGVAAVSDALDGYLARLLDQSTAIGRQLDPLVDKVMVSGAFIYLLALPADTGVAPWMVTAIVVRELLIQWLRSLLEGRGEPFGAKLSGKLKTAFQCLAITAILLALAVQPAAPWLLRARDALIWSAVGLTLYSGLAYVLIARRLLRHEAPPLDPSPGA